MMSMKIPWKKIYDHQIFGFLSEPKGMIVGFDNDYKFFIYNDFFIMDVKPENLEEIVEILVPENIDEVNQFVEKLTEIYLFSKLKTIPGYKKKLKIIKKHLKGFK